MNGMNYFPMTREHDAFLCYAPTHQGQGEGGLPMLLVSRGNWIFWKEIAKTHIESKEMSLFWRYKGIE